MATDFRSRMPLLEMDWLMPTARATTTITTRTVTKAAVYSFSFFASFCSAT